jgi:hypothetical protein
VQTLGPLKRIVKGSESVPAMKLEARSNEPGCTDLVLRQIDPAH